LSRACNAERLHWELFSLAEKDGVFFGAGWVFHEQCPILGLVLKVDQKDGNTQTIAASIHKPRDDVAARFSAFHSSRHSGFFLLGSVNYSGNDLQQVSLEVTLADGQRLVLPIPQDRLERLGNGKAAATRASKGQFALLLRRSAHMIAHFQISALIGKAKRYVGSRPGRRSETASELLTRLKADERQNVIVIIDHDMGGGANQYRDRLLARKVEEGATAIVLTYFVPSLSCGILLRNRRINERHMIPGYSVFREFADELEIREIIYNTGVSFADPEGIPMLLRDMLAKRHPRLILLAHDFFMACPSHYLLDDAGKFCGIPDVSKCQSCLVANRQDFSSMYRARDLVAWRALWSQLVDAADEFRCFSNSSLKLMKKAYPGLNLSRASVIPHAGNRVTSAAVVPLQTNALCIGVVGQIGYHKGAAVIEELAREIVARGMNTKIKIIGTIEADLDSSVVEETGPYQHRDLAAMILNSGANIMLFPSIWPETFSYVVQELMELQLPVACYDLGAPAERVATYAKGLIMQSGDVSQTLDDLLYFHKKTYLDC
jgi:glycosyltransferase involved in cell wall biosynthesis